MAGAHSRTKGAQGERDVVKILQPIVGSAYAMLRSHYGERFKAETPKLQRNSLQSDGGGSDIAGLLWAAIEVKHHAALHVDQWWAQCVEQTKYDQVSVLIYRRTGGKWHARLEVEIELQYERGPYCCVADIPWLSFLEWFYKRCMYEAAKAAHLTT